MSKRPSFGSQFEKLKSLGAGKVSEPRISPSRPASSVDAPQAILTTVSSILEESLSTANTPDSGQSSPCTVSSNDTVPFEPVKDAPCEKRTVSTTDTVPQGFTKVPHSLLRGEVKFDEPLDFMVYMHLFTYSHGFNRREAHMSQAQLERFTGSAKNTVKRSLDRLVAQGWIRCVEEYEAARMSRKWRVLGPEERDGRRGPKGTKPVSDADTEQNGQCANQSERVSKTDPPTLSKVASFKERDPKENPKNSLSVQTQTLRDYFANTKPFAKRESEMRAFRGLRQDYGEDQVAECVEHLLAEGLPNGGGSCHSPMAFLSKAMGQVWSEVDAKKFRKAQTLARSQADAERASLSRADDERAEREAQIREDAFVQAFPSSDAQATILARYGEQYPMLTLGGPALRNVAICGWWAEQNR